MRAFLPVLFIAAPIVCAAGVSAQSPQPPAQLVREVVYNELHDHAAHGHWRFWVERRSSGGTVVEEQVETADAPVSRIVRENGRPLEPQVDDREEARLRRLLASPAEQERARHQHEEDEQRIGRILALLPDAFEYEPDGMENGCYRLRFKPNPAYTTSSIEGRIFHSMSGTLWIDARYKRLARLEGHVGQDVDFGFGILGRLNKGGWFLLSRTRVSETDWKTDRLEVHMNVRAFLVKSFARDTSETRGGFEPVPAGIDLAQGVSLLEKDAETASAHNSPPRLEAPATAMSFRH